MLAHHKLIATELKISEKQVTATLNLLDDGATIPFISRYRKELTGSLDEVQVAAIRDRVLQLRDLDKRREAILKSMTELGKLTPELEKLINTAETISLLEDIYLPYKPKRKTRASIAKEKGLEPLANQIFEQKNIDLNTIAQSFINIEKGVNSLDEALAGSRDIIAELISENAEIRTKMRHYYQEKAIFKAEVIKGKEEEGIKYKDYFDWSESVKTAASHRVLAMRRGEKELILRLDALPPAEDAIAILEKQFILSNNASSKQVQQALEDGYKRLLEPAMETELRVLTKQKADVEAIKVFVENARQLLLAAPMGQKNVLAIDPGFRTGCKVVCLDKQGQLLKDTVIYPHTGQGNIKNAADIIQQLCKKYKIEAIAIGNGTAGRETESFIRGLNLPDVTIVMVNESGASIYSASDVARAEFPTQDITVRGAVSIGRRLMDPLAELVKIDPKSIGVGQYQHDVDQNKLQASLDDTVMSAVNAVGVELNTASKQILAYVSGLGPTLAQNIVDYRNTNGAFKNRESLRKVPRLGDKAYEQAAGFLRIRNAENILDSSGVHPERYDLVDKMAKDLGQTLSALIKDPQVQKQINLHQYVNQEIGLPTLTDILKELAKPGRDPREAFENFSFAEGVNAISDLRTGMKLSGIVTNITNFGAFVDIGVHQDGLVHTSQLANRFVANPNDIVKVHQKVEVTVMEIDEVRKRISLSMKTEASPKSEVQSREPKADKPKPDYKPNNNKPNFKPKQEPKIADGDLQDKLAKLKGIFK
ncbi:Tex family protein [Pedobacter mucosus]|uniref:Tex family protein n=1 Tax=Pedobacter mucosus TaxID=2895286 RepID=UPI001EE3B389|nr:Tex family protein [Pedobacter mucosus]UKT63196.1 RNA-binding transcriptional accessory protein [Pedobacter mucosus]